MLIKYALCEVFLFYRHAVRQVMWLIFVGNFGAVADKASFRRSRTFIVVVRTLRGSILQETHFWTTNLGLVYWHWQTNPLLSHLLAFWPSTIRLLSLCHMHQWLMHLDLFWQSRLTTYTHVRRWVWANVPVIVFLWTSVHHSSRLTFLLQWQFFTCTSHIKIFKALHFKLQ